MLPRNPVPPELASVASIPGMPDVRAALGSPNAAMERDFELSFRQESPADFPRGADGVIRYPHLALSGGGSNGAFGAGFLNGWTVAGNRPVFKVVTGVSTGALIAPFAFLGSQYDAALHEFYTTTSTRDIFAVGSIIFSLLRGDSLADTAPLAALIAQHVDASLLRQIADAHNRGRRLYVGTVDLDSRRFLAWNMGLIAANGHTEALNLFRRVMLASASIPLAFPPVLFEVEAEGKLYDEMHVDGFVAANVFLNEGLFRPALIHQRVGRGEAREDIFVIHNGQLNMAPSPTPRSLPGISSRVLETAGRFGAAGDLIRIFAFAQVDQASFHWVTIEKGVDLPGPEVFDTEKMTELYEIGRKAAVAGPQWSRLPPGFRERLPP